MQAYIDLLREILDRGVRKEDRTGTGVYSLFGRQVRFDLKQGFPLLTTKRLHIKSIVHELLWFLQGDTNVRSLQANNVHIWDEWADADGNLGPYTASNGVLGVGVTGVCMTKLRRLWPKFVATQTLRRLIVSAWNVGDLAEMKLPPCHCLFQFYVAQGALSCQLYQRSADVFLGVPFNIASYALLTHLIARECGLEVGDFVHSFGDLHLYTNHEAQAREQLSRTPRSLPRLQIAPSAGGLFDIKAEDISFEGYDPWPTIKAPVAV